MEKSKYFCLNNIFICDLKKNKVTKFVFRTAAGWLITGCEERNKLERASKIRVKHKKTHGYCVRAPYLEFA